jgi:hypothetical protein
VIDEGDVSGPPEDASGPPEDGTAGPGLPPTNLAAPTGERYARLGLIGVGGMGRVYLARDRWLGRVVALKEANDERLAARLAREVRVTAGLEHPGIVTVYDEGRAADGRMFYTMRLMRGRPLSQMLGERAAMSGRGWSCWRTTSTRARPWPTRTRRGWCTATSSRRTSCSGRSARRRWSTGGWRAGSTRRTATTTRGRPGAARSSGRPRT